MDNNQMWLLKTRFNITQRTKPQLSQWETRDIGLEDHLSKGISRTHSELRLQVF